MNQETLPDNETVDQDQLPKRQLGRTNLRITPIGFGAWAIGGSGWEFAWGPQDDNDSIAAIRRAVEKGINWIDTAAVYGLGHSEELIARALRDIPASNRPYVFTKCSLVWDDEGKLSHNLTPASLQRELEASLRRLSIDCIDLYQIHWAGWKGSDPAPGELERAWEALAALQREGKIRYIGVSNCSAAQLAKIEPIAPVASLQPPYSLLRRAVEEGALPWCREHNVGVIVYSPMLSGLLTGRMTRERIASLPDGDWRKRNKEFQEPNLSRNLAFVEVLKDIGSRHGRSAGEMAIAWTLRDPVITGAIVGSRSAAQIDGVIGAAAFRLSEAELEEIERAYQERIVAPSR